MLGSIASQFARIKTKNLVSGWLHGLRQPYRSTYVRKVYHTWGQETIDPAGA